MPDHNKHNLLYFESTTMRGLYETMEEWQQTNAKRLLSASIQKDEGVFCCIALVLQPYLAGTAHAVARVLRCYRPKPIPIALHSRLGGRCPS